MTFLRALFKFALFLVLAGATIVAVLGAFFVDVVEVAHDGMAPTMIAGDRVIAWRGAEAERGDVMLCRHPEEQDRWVIGRVVALPGESLRVDRGAMLRNSGHGGDVRVERNVEGQPVDFQDVDAQRVTRMRWGHEELVPRWTHLYFERVDRPFAINPIENAAGLYLLSDNRGHGGEDSRRFGFVRESDCRGQVFMRLDAVEGRLPAEIPHGNFDLLR